MPKRVALPAAKDALLLAVTSLVGLQGLSRGRLTSPEHMPALAT